jgi:putative membrane protein
MARFVRVLASWGTNIVALWVANSFFGGVHIHGAAAYLIGAGVLGIANGILKPILTILTLPLVLVTLGLFLLAINIAMVALAAWVAPNFSIHGFWTYTGTVVIIWLVNWSVGSLVDRAPGMSKPKPRLGNWS